MSKAGIVLILSLVCGTAALAVQRTQRPQRPQPKKPPAEVPAVEIGKIVERFRRAWEANDPTGIGQACADDVVMIGPGRRDRGIDEVLENSKMNFQTFPRAELGLGQLQIRVVGQTAWAHTDARYWQMTAHGTKLEYTGYASFVLERQRPGWRITLIDFNLRLIHGSLPDAKEPQPPTLEGAWLLESVKNVKTGQTVGKAAMALFTKSRVSFFAAAPDRRQPKEKKLADYSKKDLLELVRGLEANAGEYQTDGTKLIVLQRLSFLPGATGVSITFENLTLTKDRLSFEMETSEGRLHYLWRRIE